MNTLLTFITLLGCFAGMNALTCQVCGYVSGLGGDDCSDPYSTATNYSTACSGSQDTCHKSTIKIDGTLTTVSRGCVVAASCTDACGSLLSIESCQYCCTTDDCNSASAVTFSLATMAASVLGAFVAHF